MRGKQKWRWVTLFLYKNRHVSRPPTIHPTMSGDQELFESWFRVADGDRDGVVGGVEAVAFFGRSGLPQATLFQVRE